MMMEALFALPLWMSGLLLTGVLAVFSSLGLIGARKWILPRFTIKTDDSNFAATITQSIMVFYGLVVALIAVSVWQKYGQVSDVVSGEAAAIGALWRDLGGYPASQRDSMRGSLREYTRDVIADSWPMQQKGRVPRGGVEVMDHLQASLFAYEPATEGQKALHMETLRAYNQLLQMRRLRLDAVDTGLPGVLWMVILAGALISLASSFFFRVDDIRFQTVMVVLLSLFVAMVIFVVFALDRPFRGDLAITSGSYSLILDQLMKP
jgi:hypothetical protein